MSGTARHAGKARGSLVLCAAAGLAGLGALAGCSSSSSIPAYCADRTNLQNSVKGLTSLNASSGVSGLQDQIKKIQSNATALVDSAKSDFPSQTSAISSSVNTLENSVKALSSSPSASQITTVVKDASAVVTSANNFKSATASTCPSPSSSS